MGLGGFEPPTSPLSGVRSNQLSYRPITLAPLNNDKAFDQVICVGTQRFQLNLYYLLTYKGGDPAAGSPTATLLRLHPSR